MSTKNQRGPGSPAAPAPGADVRSPSGRPGGRSRTLMVGSVALGLTSAALAGMPAQAIDSNPPTGPGNIEVFPKRDMVAIEGYGEYAGKDAVITVTRGSEVIGSAKGKVDATGFLETNHPGGICWGAGTNLQVTPDIRGGDEVRVEFLNTGTPNKWDGAVTQDIEITDVARIEAGSQLVISGTFGPHVDMPGADLVADPGRALVEIVNPDMRGGTSAIGERAISWPTEPGEVNVGFQTSGGITSGAEGVGGKFQVTFDFDLATDLDLAEAGEVVGLAWQADAPPELGIEFQAGATLYEFHEASGPGMGGCPAGPQEQRPHAPTVYTGKGAGPGKVEVTWGTGTTLPSAPPITGYEVVAVRSVSSGFDAGGIVRSDADGRGATIEGLAAGEIYDVEIASRSEAGDSKPSVMRVRADDHVVPAATATTDRLPNAQGKYAPLVTGVNGDFGVHLDPVPGLLGAEVHYTVDGSTPTLQSPTFVPGESHSLQITQDTTVRWIVVDSGNIVGPMGSTFFDIVDTSNPAPEFTTVVAAPVSGAVDVSFTRLTDPAVAAYRVQAYNEAGTVRIGTPVSIAQPADGATVTRRVTGLTNGTRYTFSVAARYATVWSSESPLSQPVAPQAGPSANAGPDQTVLRGRMVTLDGSASVRALSYSWLQVRPAVTGSTYRDPILTVTGGNTMKPTFRLPLKSTAAGDDGSYQFRLTTTHVDPLDPTRTVTRTDLVDIKEQRDSITVDRNRWRAGDDLEGTGTQVGARLSFHSGSHTGPVVAIAEVVTGGEWTVPGTNAQPIGGKFYVWSDYGYVGEIAVTP